MVYIQNNFYTFGNEVKMGWVDTATSEVSILLLETNSERLQEKKNH